MVCGTTGQVTLQKAGEATSGVTKRRMYSLVLLTNRSATWPAVLQTPVRTTGQAAEKILWRTAVRAARLIASETTCGTTAETAFGAIPWTTPQVVP
jgi:hypothetical protein